MKRFLTLLLLSICCCTAATANEIAYFNHSWQEIKAKAKAENKYIFIDCYTSWCGWCKTMDKETMQEPGIVSLMNDKFVATKIDMEQGEGILLAMKYHVTGFPTFLFFNPDGELVYLSAGYQKTKEFTAELNNALDKSKQFKAPGFSNSLDVDFPEFYKAAFDGTHTNKQLSADQVYAYLDHQRDLFSEACWGVLARFDVNDKYTSFILDNVQKYQQLYGSANVNNKVYRILDSRLQAATTNKDNAAFQDVLKMIDKYVPENKETIKLNCRMEFYKAAKNWPEYGKALGEYVTKNGYDDAARLNGICRGICENCDDKKLVSNARTYMKKIVDKEPKYAYLDTYAALLYKSGKKKDAEAWANKAIAAGKKEGTDVTSTEAMLQKIKAGK